MMSKKLIAVMAVLVVSALVYWISLKSDDELTGSNGTVEHLRDVPGQRPTVALPVVSQYIQTFQLKVDGREVTTKSGEFTLPRNREVTIQGQIEFDLGMDKSFGGVYLGVGTKSSNIQGVLIEGELRLHDSISRSSGKSLVIPVDRKWQVPDRAGEFDLLVYYFVGEDGDADVRAKFLIKCPVRIE
jgi:hypothetical protein